jgi:gliding motility-associated-like protein
MKIEDLFKEKMSNANVKAPEGLWNKIESNLNQIPSNTNITNNAQNILTNASSTFSTTLKVIAVSCGVGAASIGGYLIYDNMQENPTTPTTISQTQTNTPKNSETIFDTTKIILEKQTPITKQSQTKPITTTTQTPIDTTILIEQTPQTKQETLIVQQPQTTPQPAPAQPAIEEVKPIEETPVIEEEIAQIQEEIFEPNIKRPNFVSPNNDGINDIFKIENLESYPDNELIIFDKNGRIIYQANPYNNDWEAANIQQGTYFYKLLIKQGQNKKIFNGSITIML